MVRQVQYTLLQASRILDEPQHRLIYFCEKGVVSPDFGKASGRGSSRKFSARNLLEFAIALKFRELMIPASVIGTVLYVLRRFEERVRHEIPEFVLPGSLCEPDSPQLRVIITDGPRLFFSIAVKSGVRKLFGGVELRHISWVSPGSAQGRGGHSSDRSAMRREKRDNFFLDFGQVHGGMIDACDVKLEIDINRIASSLSL